MKPGIYRGIPNEQYHSGPGVSKSLLDLLRQSPAHLRAAVTSTEPRKPTPSQAFGTAFHMLVLEPSKFEASYAEPFVPPADALATMEDMQRALAEHGVEFKKSARKAELATLVRERLPGAVLYDDAKSEYLARLGSRVELSAADWERLHAMRDAVLAHKAASKLLSAPGEAELSAYWREPVAEPVRGRARKILCRVRPDFWRRDGILVDLKSTHIEGADPESFSRAVNTYRYHVQDAMYTCGAASAWAETKRGFDDFAPPRAFVFIAVEKDACVVDGVAKGVAVYQLGKATVDIGRQLFREDLLRFAQCELSGRWPGYPEEIQPLELPAYAFTKAAVRAA